MIVMLTHDNACLLPPMGHHALQQAQSAAAHQQKPAAGSTVSDQTGSKCNVYHFEQSSAQDRKVWNRLFLVASIATEHKHKRTIFV
jgi:hypothetical protein